MQQMPGRAPSGERTRITIGIGIGSGNDADALDVELGSSQPDESGEAA